MVIKNNGTANDLLISILTKAFVSKNIEFEIKKHSLENGNVVNYGMTLDELESLVLHNDITIIKNEYENCALIKDTLDKSVVEISFKEVKEE